MLTKKKVCAGWDGKEHFAYIYKNINGKKYCLACTQRLEPRKIKKMSEKQAFKITLKKEQIEKDKAFYLEIWISRFFQKTGENTYKRLVVPKCENPECNKSLGDEPNLFYFHHFLEKETYPQYRHEKWNIGVICPDCHNSYHSFPDSVPYLQKMKQDKQKWLLTREVINKTKSF